MAVDMLMSIDSNIDYILKHPEEVEEIFAELLQRLGLEKNNETLLSFINGWLLGELSLQFSQLQPTERENIIELLRRRSQEILESFMSTRINKSKNP